MSDKATTTKSQHFFYFNFVQALLYLHRISYILHNSDFIHVPDFIFHKIFTIVLQVQLIISQITGPIFYQTSQNTHLNYLAITWC